MADKYQERYLAHQSRKRALIVRRDEDLRRVEPVTPPTPFDSVRRRSVRLFVPGPPIPHGRILGAMNSAPSSCNRCPLRVGVVLNRDRIEDLSWLLVGGAGWLHRAGCVLLVFADPAAYKAPGEIAYMPYLDVGAAVMTGAYKAASLGLGSCWVNPNIREPNRVEFHERFNPEALLFGSALALGWPAEAPPRPERKEVFRELVYYRDPYPGGGR